MSSNEQALVIDCEGDALFGVLSRPQQARDVGVVIVTGGPQYRAGSHRFFVTLARSLENAGYAVLRFDYRGMGDSGGDLRAFDDVNADVGAALDAFATTLPEVRRFVLWGLCDGASASLMYVRSRPDPRVVGLALLNPWVRTVTGEARTRIQHYYFKRLQQKDFWSRLGSGKVAWSAATGLVRSVATALGPKPHAAKPAPCFTENMAEAWSGFAGPILLMMSEHDRVAREFEHHVDTHATWQSALKARPPKRVDITGADHTCAPATAKAQVEAATLAWLSSMPDAASRPDSAAQAT